MDRDEIEHILRESQMQFTDYPHCDREAYLHSYWISKCEQIRLLQRLDPANGLIPGYIAGRDLAKQKLDQHRETCEACKEYYRDKK